MTKAIVLVNTSVFFYYFASRMLFRMQLLDNRSVRNLKNVGNGIGSWYCAKMDNGSQLGAQKSSFTFTLFIRMICNLMG